MTSLRSGSATLPAERSDARATVWGLDALGLHDRWWASRGVQTVRRGRGQQIERDGPELYLLIEPEELVHFEPAPVVKRLAWLKPGVMRVRIVDLDTATGAERVEVNDDHTVRAIRRDYRPSLRSTSRVLLTANADAAKSWGAAPRRDAALQSLVRGEQRARTAVAQTRGRVLDARSDAGSRESLGILLHAWKTPGSTVPGVFEFSPGVFAHETTHVDSGARMVGPVWLGAGARLGADAVLVGPALAADSAPNVDPGAVPWSEALSPAWRLRPRMPGRPGWSAAKRAFDILFSLAVLALTLPLYPFIMAAIVLEDGRPVFFAHTRQTRGGRNFPCLKFRTMCRNAEAMKAELARKNQADGPQFFIDNDPRLLRCGRLLRRFQLDELPQFLNVLAGHMSVVGPRPSPDKENQYCPAWREARLSVRPGVTGLWQVRRTRAPETDFQEWIRYDLEYVQNQGWRLDLWIIWKTLARMIGG